LINLKVALIPVKEEYVKGNFFLSVQAVPTLIAQIDPDEVGFSVDHLIEAIKQWKNHGFTNKPSGGFDWFFEDLIGTKSDGSTFRYGVQLQCWSWTDSEVVSAYLIREWGRGTRTSGGYGSFILVPYFTL